MRLGDLDALKEDFKSRLALCNEWIEKAKDKETKIRASAIKAFIGEVIMTIDNAPTIEPETKVVANVTFNKEQVEELVEKAKADILAQIERPQGEWIFNSDSLTDDMIATHYCSICGKGAYSGHDNYCWNCGADMRNNNKETTFDDYLKEQLKDPEFRKEWEKLQDEDIQKGGKEE